MRRASSLLALACCLAACSKDAPDAPRPATPSPASAGKAGDADKSPPAGTRLTIYSGDYEQLASADAGPGGGMPGYVLVDRTLQYALKAGSNRVSASDVPRAMDVEAATLKPLGDGLDVVSQRYLAPPAGSREMLAAAVGKRVTVEHTSGGTKQTDSGDLMSTGDGLVLALSDGRIKAIRQYDNFSLVDADALPPRRATLQWTVQAGQAGDARFELAYPMGGMAWRAEYLATLASGPACRLELDGAALVANRSGTPFQNAKLTLVAGEPARERQQDATLDRVEVTGARIANQAYAPPTPVERRSGEYHAYELPGSYQVADGSTERVPLFRRLSGVTCERAYETTPEIGLWQPPQPLIDPGFNDAGGEQPVKSVVSLKNDESSHLGRPLPAGRVRVFEGRDFLGESMLDHTPDGADIRLETGTAFDLTAERERTAFRVDRAGRTMTESFAITLKNAKDDQATVTVVEPVPRWSDWQIVDASVPAKKRDAQRAEFAVEVPAHGEARLTYTARYRWAPGIRP